jgi:hypothetical protein
MERTSITTESGFGLWASGLAFRFCVRPQTLNPNWPANRNSSREAAQEYSPRRKPWVKAGTDSALNGRKKRFHVHSSGFRSCLEEHGLFRHYCQRRAEHSIKCGVFLNRGEGFFRCGFLIAQIHERGQYIFLGGAQ